MPLGTAKAKLHKQMIWDFLVRATDSDLVEDAYCDYCGEWIASPEDLAITHDESWSDNADLFWDLRNVAFMHLECATQHSAEREASRRQKEQTVKYVELSVIGENGKRLPGVMHNGRLHVAGESGQRYKLRLRNTTHDRLEVVLTVDGRDIISGEVGSKDNRGYILKPLETFDIEGWRTSDAHVAAFRFGADKDKAYSTQMGTGQHLGVIGLAVYREKAAPVFVPRTPVQPFGGPWPSYDPHIRWTSNTSDMSSGGGGVYGASVSVSTCSAKGRGGVLRSVSLNSVEAPREDVQLGTEFGEEISSSVTSTSFTRRSKDPSQTLTVEYDTVSNLRAKGVPIDRAISSASGPSAFPADDPTVKDNNGYCKRPAK